MICGDNWRKILVGINNHAGMMHGIAQLALFGYRYPVLIRFVCVGYCIPGHMLVSVHHPLPCHKADQDDPGVNDMSLTLFQNSRLSFAACSKNS